MKILDPQSSILPLPELQTFLSSQPHRKPDPKIGGYTAPNLRGYRAITKDFNSYVNNLAPHVKDLPPLSTGWMQKVVRLLSLPKKDEGAGDADDGVAEGNGDNYGYGLTKGEVLMVIELGIAMKRVAREGGEDGGGEEEEEEEEEEEAPENNGLLSEEEMDASDTQVLHAVVEELGERFTDEEVSEMLQSVRRIVEEAREVDVDGGEVEESKGKRKQMK